MPLGRFSIRFWRSLGGFVPFLLAFLRLVGGDAVGMSTIPEVIVANHLSLPVAAISVLTDECDPDHLAPVDINDIIAQAKKAEPDMVQLFSKLIEQL